MLMITISRNFRAVYGFSFFMFLAAASSLFLIAPYTTHKISTLIIIDNYGIMFLGIILGASILITVISYEYLKKQFGEREEYFIILFLAVLGATFLILANSFVTFFLGLETLSISLYVLIAYLKVRNDSIEAGVKFLIISSLSSAFLLFGMGLIYAQAGTMNFQEIASAAGSSNLLTPIFLTGTGLILAGIGFKLALVPFHIWTPDVYQGAPAPVTTFIATVSKGSVLALALRLFIDIRGFENNTLVIVVSGISALSMFTGNLLALNQINIKRLLAYSSIANMGYLMIPLLTGTTNGIEAAMFYLAAYLITTLGAFGVISILSVCERDAENVEDFRGLFWTNPWLATVMTLALLSLAGIPLTAGFISKFYVVLTGVNSGLWLLAVCLIINSVISLFYYLRVIKTMFSSEGTKAAVRVPVAANIALIIILTGILFLGLFPSFMTELIGSFSAIN
jgi:NADH-quinone oxidoreductase subunit N